MNEQRGYPTLILTYPDNNLDHALQRVGELHEGEIAQVELPYMGFMETLLHHLNETYPNTIFTGEKFKYNESDYAYIYIKKNRMEAV